MRTLIPLIFTALFTLNAWACPQHDDKGGPKAQKPAPSKPKPAG